MDYTQEMFRLVRAELVTIGTIPLPKVFYDGTSGAHTDLPVKKWLYLYDADGVCGQAPCTPIMENTLLPIVLTGKTQSYDELMKSVYWAVRNNSYSGETYIETGRLDLALQDIMAKRRELPLHRFWGAAEDGVTVYASGLGANYTDEELLSEAARYASEGYRTMKMKVAMEKGSRVDQDVARVAAVRREIGPDIALAIDANQCWSADEALRFIKRVESYNIAWFEEPVGALDFEGIRTVCKESAVEIGMGESLRNAALFDVYLDCGLPQVQPVWSNLAGLEQVRRIGEAAGSRNVRVTLGGITQLAGCYSLAIGGVLTEYLEPLFRPLDDILSVYPRIRNGYMELPCHHGMPIALDLPLLIKTGFLENIKYYYAGRC